MEVTAVCLLCDRFLRLALQLGQRYCSWVGKVCKARQESGTTPGGSVVQQKLCEKDKHSSVLLPAVEIGAQTHRCMCAPCLRARVVGGRVWAIHKMDESIMPNVSVMQV